jgi:hypothetical protein
MLLLSIVFYFPQFILKKQKKLISVFNKLLEITCFIDIVFPQIVDLML